MKLTDARVIAPILICYLVIGILFSLMIPVWEAPDEPAHYNYVRQLASGRFPVMTATDYDQVYQSEVISSDFAPSFSVEPFSYEDYQPPLYYLLQTPIYWITAGSPLAMRLMGVFLGAITLLLAWEVFSRVTKSAGLSSAIPLIAIAFFAFLPQHVAIQASINNDSLAELLIASGLLLLLLDVPKWRAPSHLTFWPKSRNGRLLAVVLGLCLLTKVTAYLLILVVGISIIWSLRWNWGAIVRKSFETFTVPFLIGCTWWVRNLIVYGWPDFLGIQAHDAVVVGQPTTAEWIDQFGFQEVARRFFQTTFRSFWGQFGWMEVVMPTWVYTILAIFSGIVLLGFLASLYFGTFSPSALYPFLTTLFVLNLLLYLAYNMTYVQHQGRYFFSSLIPISFAVAFGIWFFIGQNKVHLKLPNQTWGYMLSAGLIGLNLLALFRFILPAL